MIYGPIPCAPCDGHQIWSPTAADTALWLDAQDSSTVSATSGGTYGFGEWADKGPDGLNFSSYVPTANPTYSDGAVGGKPGWTFDDSESQAMVHAGVSWADSDYTMFFVSSTNRIGAAANNYLFSTIKVGAWNFLSVANSTAGGNYQYHMSANLDYVGVDTSVAVTTPTQIRCYRFKSPDSASIRLNGKDVYTGGDYTSTRAVTLLMLGRANSTEFAGGYFGGAIGEVIVYTSNLTDAQVQKTEAYLAWRWGLGDQLAASNPYKSCLPPCA